MYENRRPGFLFVLPFGPGVLCFIALLGVQCRWEGSRQVNERDSRLLRHSALLSVAVLMPYPVLWKSHLRGHWSRQGSALPSARPSAWYCACRRTTASVRAAQLTHWWKGSAFHNSGSLHNGQPVDLLAALRAANPQADISADAGWRPQPLPQDDPVEAVAGCVPAGAGAGTPYFQECSAPFYAPSGLFSLS